MRNTTCFLWISDTVITKKNTLSILLLATALTCTNCNYERKASIGTVEVPVTLQNCVIGKEGVTEENTTEKIEINGAIINYSRCRNHPSIGSHYVFEVENKNANRLVELEANGISTLLSNKKYLGFNASDMVFVRKQVESIKITTFPDQTLTKNILFEVPVCKSASCNKSAYRRFYTGNVWSIQIASVKHYNDQYWVYFLNNSPMSAEVIFPNGDSSGLFGGRDKVERVRVQVPGPGKYKFKIKRYNEW